jgi:hypothetical protein
MAADESIPAPNDVKNNSCFSENLMYLDSKAPTKDVTPANVQTAIT